jgi:hypothetical protein
MINKIDAQFYIDSNEIHFITKVRVKHITLLNNITIKQFLAIYLGNSIS